MSKDLLRILQIGMYDSLGGIETYLINYYNHMDRDKVQFDFINMHDKIYFQDELINLGAKIYRVENVKRNPVKFYNDLVKIIKKNNYNIVHVNMLSAANIIPLIAAKRAGAKIIVAHSHNANTPKNYIKKIMHFCNKKLILKFANYYFACSELAGKWLFGDKIIDDKSFIIINNAIDINKFKYSKVIREKYRDQLDLKSKFIVGHVGRFSEQKNHEFLIDIFNKVHAINHNCMLLLIGTGELQDSIKNKVKELGLENSVKFLGVRLDINSIYQAMDVFILPSLFEGLPLVGIEAQVAGLKCIFSDSITEEVKIIKDTEFVSLNDSLDYWAKKVLEPYDTNKRCKISEQVRELGYDIKEEAKKLERFYLNIK